MSMTTYVVGIKPPDETWKKMKKAFDGCRDAGIDPPQEIWDFFNGESPDDKGVIIDDGELRNDGAIVDYKEEGLDGIEVLIKKLPKDIKIIRFVNSY